MTSAGHLHRAEEGNHASKLCLGILLPCQGEFPSSFPRAGWVSAPGFEKNSSSRGVCGGDGHRTDLISGAEGGLFL